MLLDTHQALCHTTAMPVVRSFIIAASLAFMLKASLFLFVMGDVDRFFKAVVLAAVCWYFIETEDA